tara:strand:+ start:129 stop:368 length:240 start_codon:yes stop_codon:yes gene_type:complete
MANGYQMFAKLHPPGSLYRYKAVFDTHDGWKAGKVYLLTKWEVPEGISEKSPLRNAFFLVDGKERCVDISFFRYLEQVE